MSEDWNRLAAQIREMKERIVALEKENAHLRRVLELADALRNDERGAIVTSANTADVIELNLNQIEKGAH